jgi:alkyl hydroperoxide reductase subunit D
MSLDTFKEQLGPFARDTFLNIGTVLTEEGAPGLTQKQIESVALACGYALSSVPLKDALEASFSSTLDDNDRIGAKSAASIMAMNNIYYRFIHLAEDSELSRLPAKLRMQVIGKPPVDKVTFELMCLGVSALSGCGNCIKAHIHEAKKSGLSQEAIQSIARIASVLHAAAVSHRIS